LEYSSWFEQSSFAAFRRARADRKFTKKRYQQVFELLEQNARRLFFNVRGRSGTPAGSLSTVNYANINAIHVFLQDMIQARHGLQAHVTILVPFAAQLVEMTQFFRRTSYNSIKILTIDSYQGSEDDIIILCLTPANQDDPAFIGFLRNWNRINVATTRAKQALAMFDNLDTWCQRIESLKASSESFAMMAIDVRDRGDVVDMERYQPANHFLASSDGNIECPPSRPRTMLGSEQIAPIRALDAAENSRTASGRYSQSWTPHAKKQKRARRRHVKLIRTHHQHWS
jgi:hypothetical protein